VGRALPASPQRRGPLRRLARFLEHADLPAARRHIRYVTQLNFSEAMKRDLAAPALRGVLGRDKAWAAVEQHLAGLPAPPRQAGQNGGILARAMWADMRTYLVDDVLTMTDKMSMWSSLEVRVPLLDHRLVEYMAAVPARLKVGPAGLKVLLRRLLRRRLPADVLDRPKHGFAVPLVAWVGQRLRPFFEEVLLDAGAACRTYFDPAVVARLLDEHAAGRADHSHRLWQLVVFDLWHRTYLGPDAPRPVRADAIPAA
jgi:asparagine synthase (glutamine-hydrolysing)